MSKSNHSIPPGYTKEKYEEERKNKRTNLLIKILFVLYGLWLIFS